MARKKTTTAKKTTSKKAAKVEDMSQAHGKEETPLYTTLEQIWGLANMVLSMRMSMQKS